MTGRHYLAAVQRKPGALRNGAPFAQTRPLRVARSRAFTARVTALYEHRCALCGEAYHTEGGLSEVEAGHVVPRALKGADGARNGLALCRSHHCAFDRGLFGVVAGGSVLVPPPVLVHPRNSSLTPFHGSVLRPPLDPAMAPSPAALAWHLAEIVRA